MSRSPLFWVVLVLIVAGVGLAAVLGALYWLGAVFLAVLVALLVAFLIAAYGVGRPEHLHVPHLPSVAPSHRIPVVHDCDVSMGRPFRDAGDGLALLYLLGEPRVELEGVTTTYGSGPVEMTTRVARELLADVGRSDVPVRPGAVGPEGEARASQAARYLANLVAERPGEIIVVATGSMTNLRHAAELEPGFFARLRGLYVLGGVTGPLTWNGRRLAERNFTLDPEGAWRVVRADCPLTIAPGQAGLSAVLRKPQFAALQSLRDPVARLVVRKTRLWFALMRLYFQDGGFGMWDSVPALMVTHPGLFDYHRADIFSTREDLRTGRLVLGPDSGAGARIVDGVLDFEGFVEAHFAAWRRLSEGEDE